MLGNLLRRTRIGDRIRGALRHDAEEAMKPLRKELRRLARDVEGLQAMLQETAVRAARGDRASSQLRLMLELNERQRDRIAALPELLNEAPITAHVKHAIAAAPLQLEPFEHIVVDGILPPALYDLLLALPPEPFFQDHDRIKQDMHFPITSGPTLASTVWNFVDGVLARRVIQPPVLEKFHEPLQGHFDTVF